jgi:hypothetical protein
MPDYRKILSIRPIAGEAYIFQENNNAIRWKFDAKNVYDTINALLRGSKPVYRRHLSTLIDHSWLALGVLLHNYVMRRNADGLEYSSLKAVHHLLNTYAEKKTSKIFDHTVGLSAELFAYYAAFESKEADDLADLIVDGGQFTIGKLLIEALIAPREKSPSPHHRDCLYTKLYEAIGRKGDVAEWLKANIAQKHMPAALAATQWTEFLSIMNKRGRGMALEDSLGL